MGQPTAVQLKSEIDALNDAVARLVTANHAMQATVLRIEQRVEKQRQRVSEKISATEDLLRAHKDHIAMLTENGVMAAITTNKLSSSLRSINESLQQIHEQLELEEA